MNVKTLLTVGGVVSLLFGVFFLIAPDSAASLFGGVVDSASHRLTLRFLGAATIALGATSIMGSKAAMSYGRRAILAGGLISSILVVILLFYGMSDGVSGSGTWGTIIIDLLLAAGFGFYLSKEKPS